MDKPTGPTSHDAVAIARRSLRERRIGHTGTLDPFASGLLLLCLGPATRLAEYLTALPKRYLATLRLGITTDTDDRTGEAIAESTAWQRLSDDEVRQALSRQSGEILQLPPIYSAKKVAGERMYAVARRGEQVERHPVQVTVYEMKIVSVELPYATFEVECSAGTYIRSIARDVGEALGVGAHLESLRRTAVGRFGLDTAVPLDQLADPQRVSEALLSPAEAVQHLPALRLTEAMAGAVRHGRPVALPGPQATPEQAAGLVALHDPAGELLAIGEARDGSVYPKKVFG